MVGPHHGIPRYVPGCLGSFRQRRLTRDYWELRLRDVYGSVDHHPLYRHHDRTSAHHRSACRHVRIEALLRIRCGYIYPCSHADRPLDQLWYCSRIQDCPGHRIRHDHGDFAGTGRSNVRRLGAPRSIPPAVIADLAAKHHKSGLAPPKPWRSGFPCAGRSAQKSPSHFWLRSCSSLFLQCFRRRR